MKKHPFWKSIEWKEPTGSRAPAGNRRIGKKDALEFSRVNFTNSKGLQMHPKLLGLAGNERKRRTFWQACRTTEQLLGRILGINGLSEAN